MQYVAMKDDKIEVRRMFDKLPKKVQGYILEEHKQKYEFDDMIGVGNNVLEHNMFRTICSEYKNHGKYFEYAKRMDELKQSLKEAKRHHDDLLEMDNHNKVEPRRMSDSVSKLKMRIESCKRSLAIHERNADKRHESRVSKMEMKIARRGYSIMYDSKQRAEEYRQDKQDKKNDALRKSVCANHLNMDKYYTTFAQYDYMMNGGEHYIVMNRKRDDLMMNVENAVRPLTMKAAELLVNLSRFKSEEYNWVRWPNVYEARDMHLVGLNGYMLGKTDDVDTSIFTLKEYEHNQRIESQMTAVNNRIVKWCENNGCKMPKADTLNEYPDSIQKLYVERESLREQKVKDLVTMLIVSPELMSVARCMVLENGGDGIA